MSEGGYWLARTDGALSPGEFRITPGACIRARSVDSIQFIENPAMCSALPNLPPEVLRRMQPPKPHWWQAEFWRLDRLRAEAARVRREAMVGTFLLLALIVVGAYGLADWMGWL